MHVVLITGISGSGKSVALRVLEDDGYFCIDNLPLRFLVDVVDALAEAGHEKVALSIDVRSGGTIRGLRETVGEVARYGHDIKILFLDARTETLVQRYSESRRRHPLAMVRADEPPPTLIEAIDREREVMAPLQDIGISLDTTDLHPNVLRQWVREAVGTARAPLTLAFESFAYKHGVPMDADLVFDVRCLPNPFYLPELRPLTGLDAPVCEYLGDIPSVRRMIDDIATFVRTWLPQYLQEHRSYLTVAIGCTGGQHRSVFVVETLAQEFSRYERVLVRHRSLANRRALSA